jgi:hypothetical protein
MPDNNDHRLWYMLLGAMLASQPVRKSAIGKITYADVPKGPDELWRWIEAGDAEAVRGCVRGMKVDVWDDGVLPSLIRHLQEQAMGVLCENMIARAQFTRLQKPEELRDKFMKMASVLDARVESLAKSRAEGQAAAQASNNGKPNTSPLHNQ